MKSQKPKILYLVHRIPYPPNKGDKIRSFNILKALSEHYDVYLACFVDDENDRQYEALLDKWCKESICVSLNGVSAKLSGLTGFVSNKAITLPYYKNHKIQGWVDSIVSKNNIQRAVVFSSAMCQFLESHPALLASSVIDFVDIDSDKWQQYALNKQGLKRWFYSREAKLLGRYEQEMLKSAAFSTFVSEDEASLFKKLSESEYHHKVHGIRNGVDLEFFDSDNPEIPVIEVTKPSLAFTGAMDYWANINAILWFVNKVWPLVLLQAPTAHLYIVGSKPTKEVVKLASHPNITVTGRVEDVRPYIKQTSLSIAPLQIARGIQNKVLEAMAMKAPIVLSKMAAEGIKSESSDGYWVKDSPTDTAETIIEHLESAGSINYEASREFVKHSFSWDSEMKRLMTLIEKGVAQNQAKASKHKDEIEK